VSSVSLNGRPIPFKLQANETDLHLHVRFPVYGGPSVLRVQMRHDFAITYTPQLPVPGARSEGLRILSEEWSSAKDQLSLTLEGIPGRTYELSLFQGKEVTGAEGGTLRKDSDMGDSIQVSMPTGSDPTVRSTLVLRFAPLSTKGSR
jgi:hypothetical protein